MILNSFSRFCFSLIVICLTIGCDFFSEENNTSTQSAAEQEQILKEYVQAYQQAEYVEPPEPKIRLAVPEGWRRSETRSLPPEEHGFTVKYEHESGLAVTLYQYTRGLESIPNDVYSDFVNAEMQGAKSGIQLAVEYGLWQSAEEVKTEVVPLGDSSLQAMWSQYLLGRNGVIVVSDIYIWTHQNTIFKIRSTSRSEDVDSNQDVLKPLLTAFGDYEQVDDDEL